ncbi:Na+/H+ antiporter NhaA [Subsaximicrobium wynnwilliamsii]|uniref:Na(+)/H(+) antiporter NhaA n=1 Tax=Subsaximicrobium wynnwilliamsii TaxID=291179 RepID=A0A5C6ZNL0_9FLAO|nr:Na+/H+ antiporter NhaA [Subsaximicrobium wynnwilliamsii]TXD85551.1 Na+/H+ antiporter NhaA [Subsaximicrobium wynnwilliamsii]TXD90904.1 Na+/H+ antiporter NhaA [Subsaximicrobium wynnwilliamsii]TXE05411.1 Na+/H+ antiporter NhaA [Subsaximicrobium wynnwilliamsii]
MANLTQSFNNFFKKDSAPGILLIVATIAALIVANTPLKHFYTELMHIKFSMGFDEIYLSKSLHHWVNDFLMALFFLLVGLEIKSELKFGGLRTFKSAIFPVVAAISGALFPALIFIAFNQGTDYIKGWAIPMATDIAFVIGIIAMLGSRMPSWAKVFITTIAVVDDLIAVLVIAFFYTDDIRWQALGIAGICTLVLLFLNYKNVNRLTPYLAVGFILWWAVLASGIHATIAGVILAMTVPLRREWRLGRIKAFARKGFKLFKRAKDSTLAMTTPEVHRYLENTQREMESPLKRLERKLHAPVYFFIMPVFAFVNAGIVFNSEILNEAFHLPITWGTILGLSVGKPFGVLLAIWILLKFFYKNMPQTPEIWKLLMGISLLCGIGFTMSLFIVNLSFMDEVVREEAKIGILLASLLNGVLGYWVLHDATKKPEAITADKINITR